MAAIDILELQGNIKKDAIGYHDEFLLQYRHFQSLMDVFKLSPSKESKEFGELANFIAQVSKCYPKDTADFAPLLMGLLDTHYAVLDSGLRKTLVQALILLRNRNQLPAIQVLPLFFRLFRCQDKTLRQLLFRHIVADIKNNNKHHRNEQLNRQLQNFMHSVLGDDNEAAAKKSLAVCTELWRRHVWRDARTVNVIATAASHKSSRIMLAAVKFFLGQDKVDDSTADSDEENDAAEGPKPSAPTKEDVYKAYNAGTRSSRKKKQHRLKRAMASVKKAHKKESGETARNESFAALHLLHDPQAFVEKLFSRLQSGGEKFEARMALMALISRVVGVHKLMLLNFYPFLQKYIAPHTRDVTQILAALVGAAHDLVPPDVLAPVLRQLVDQFVHDRARPEVMAVGLKTVRELCLRCPLLMEPELLQDLAAYKKFRDKEVSSAARGLIGLFRELNPEMLAKKDRGRGADLAAKPRAYGEADVADRVDGADLLEAAEAAGQGSSDDDYQMPSMGSSDEEMDDGSDGDLTDLDSEDEGEDGGSGEWEEVEAGGSGEGEEGGSGSGSGSEEEEGGSSDVEEDSEEGGDSEEDGVEEDGEEEEAVTPKVRGRGLAAGNGKAKAEAAKRQLEKQTDSIASLKKKLADAKARKEAAGKEGAGSEGGEDEAAVPKVHIEAERILTQEDFDRIRKLKQKRLIETALSKHGLKTASTAKRARLLEAAEEEAQQTLELREMRGVISQMKVDPAALASRKKRGHDKESRLATVLAGREGREKFGAKTGLKQKKTGGLSERQKQRKKALPLAARMQQLKRRSESSKRKKSGKNFKGHVRG